MDASSLSAITGPVLLSLGEQDIAGIRLSRSFVDLQHTVAALISGAEGEVTGFFSPSPLVARLFDADVSASVLPTHGRTGRRLQRRATYDPAVLDLPHSSEALVAQAAAGEQLRFLAGLSSTVFIADTKTAVVDLTCYDSSGAGSLLITDRRMVLALRALSDMIWRMGIPMADDGELTLDKRTQAVLSLLGAGLPDSGIAEQLRISQRTVERTVRALMERLGATTRFQAGVLAGRRGFL